MNLDNESRLAMITYRQEKSVMALDDAAFLTEGGRYNLAANRLYPRNLWSCGDYCCYAKSSVSFWGLIRESQIRMIWTMPLDLSQ